MLLPWLLCGPGKVGICICAARGQVTFSGHSGYLPLEIIRLFYLYNPLQGASSQEHAIGQELPSYIKYFSAFSYFYISNIYCTFQVTGWLNLITHSLFFVSQPISSALVYNQSGNWINHASYCELSQHPVRSVNWINHAGYCELSQHPRVHLHHSPIHSLLVEHSPFQPVGESQNAGAQENSLESRLFGQPPDTLHHSLANESRTSSCSKTSVHMLSYNNSQECSLEGQTIPRVRNCFCFGILGWCNLSCCSWHLICLPVNILSFKGIHGYQGTLL